MNPSVKQKSPKIAENYALALYNGNLPQKSDTEI